MANAIYTTVITVIPRDRLINFYSYTGEKSGIQFESKPYKARLFDEEFFNEFTRCLNEYGKAKPAFSGKAAKVTVVLPDGTIAVDSVNIPGVNKKSMDNLTNVAIEAKYKNLKELKLNKATMLQNKQYSTVAITAISQKLLQSLYTSCAGSNMFASIVTFAGNAAVDGAIALNQKLKGGNFILLDIKETSSRMAFVVKGVTMGSIEFQFGYDILAAPKAAAENLLFEHSTAELAVINAKEKAKAKQLTMMGGNTEEPEEETEGEEAVFTVQDDAQQRQIQIKTLPKKTARVLPKWMQRPMPETVEGVAYENFRIFLKWVLEFIRGNSRLTAIAPPEVVYVNMPEQYSYIYDMVNAEETENGIRFTSLDIEKERDIITRNLELYGGLFAGLYNLQNNF